MEKKIMEHSNDYDPPEKPAILAIDDNEEILDLLSDELGDDYQVFTAENADIGLRLLQEQNINLIISDVMMDGMDGFALCRKLKTSFEFGHLPIVMLTAKNTVSAKIEGLELGADAYVEKPFTTDILKAQLASLLLNRAKIKHYYAGSPFTPIKSIAYTSDDELFLERLNDLILTNLRNNKLSVDDLASMMNVSKPTLYRKIKSISNLSPNELINVARLKKAAELLVQGSFRMYEITEMVGYSSQTYFSHSFLKQFGILPSEFQMKQRAT